MSHAGGQVLFRDGLVLHTEYDGTGDTIWTGALFETPAELHANWRDDEDHECACNGSEPVTYWTSYGGGWTFPARACRACLVVVRGDPDDELEDGRPDWVVGEDHL